MSWTERLTFSKDSANENNKSMEDLDKKYYKIRDVADFIGVPVTTIRYWEKEFPDISPLRSGRGIRHYTPSDIEILRIVHYLIKVRGLRIEAAKEQMRINRKNISKKIKVLDELKELRGELESMLKILGKRR